MPVVIKNVDKESWRSLKAEAARHGVTTGKMLEMLVKEHVHREKSHRDAWNALLRRKPLLTAREAEEIKKEAEQFRKSFGMRL